MVVTVEDSLSEGRSVVSNCDRGFFILYNVLYLVLSTCTLTDTELKPGKYFRG